MQKSTKELIIDKLKEATHKKYTKAKLLKDLNISSDDTQRYKRAIKQLRKNKIIIKHNNKYIKLNENIEIIIGEFQYNPKGYGFIILKDKEEDIFIPRDNIGDALNGDRVIVKITKKRSGLKKAEGEIIDVIKRNLHRVVGTYIANENFGFVIPDNPKINKDIYIPKGQINGAQSYDKVVCKITKYPIKGRNQEGSIIEVIGLKEEKGVDVASILKEKRIKIEFPPKILQQVEKLSDEISEMEMKSRRDLTDLNIFTIDRDDAKDLDDAVSIEILENGNYRLGVHIADVTHYVKENTKLDKEAYNRGTSIYLVDTVVPMLPKKLSNNLCSLNTDGKKLTLSVFMEVDNHGIIVNREVLKSFIQSKAQLTYSEVTKYLLGENPQMEVDKPQICNDLKSMEELANILAKKKKDRGCIEFDFPEPIITLNEEGKVIDVQKHERGISNQIIEEFMIACNETIAEIFYWNKIPFVFRIHESPRADRLIEFNKFITQYGYKIDFKEDDNGNIEVTPKELQALLEEIKGKSEEKALNIMLLRSLQQASYFPNCIGHFGLSTKYYCHFTSPIRRYPDLQIHRIIKEFISNGISKERINQLEKTVKEASRNCSKLERFAKKVEEEFYEIKKIEYMKDKIGNKYEGVITTVNSSGFVVTLDNTIEGYVRIDEFKDDSFDYSPEQFTLESKTTGKTFKIGDVVPVVVDKVNEDIRLIQFKVQ